MGSHVSKERLGILYILVGPGGVGKNALLNAVMDQLTDLRQLATATTRPPRENEQDGVHHLFVDLATFQQMIEDDALLEYQEVHPGKYYGVPRAIVEQAIVTRQDLIADIEYKGAAIIQKTYPQNTVAVFIAPPTYGDLVERMQARDATPGQIAERMERAAREMVYAMACDYVIVNDDLESSVGDLRDIILAERRGSSPVLRYDVTFRVRVWTYAGESLLLRDGEPLTVTLQPGDMPEAVARREVESVLGVRVSALDYRLPDASVPVEIDFDGDTYRLSYNYSHTLSAPVPVPDGWAWTERVSL